MGKLSKIVYICDICKTESEKELPVCEKCKKDYCNNCSTFVKAHVYISPEEGEQKTLIDEQYTVCSECGDKLTLKDIIKFNDGKAGEFSVEARD